MLILKQGNTPGPCQHVFWGGRSQLSCHDAGKNNVPCGEIHGNLGHSSAGGFTEGTGAAAATQPE